MRLGRAVEAGLWNSRTGIRQMRPESLRRRLDEVAHYDLGPSAKALIRRWARLYGCN